MPALLHRADSRPAHLRRSRQRHHGPGVRRQWLPAPTGINGGLGADGKVTFTFNRVAGAKAYRAFKNGQALQWISDWGQPTLQVADASPCAGAHYQVCAMSAENTAASSIGQITTLFRLNSSNRLAAFRLAAGTTLNYRVSAYNDLVVE
jgi:hypothetical protein